MTSFQRSVGLRSTAWSRQLFDIEQPFQFPHEFAHKTSTSVRKYGSGNAILRKEFCRDGLRDGGCLEVWYTNRGALFAEIVLHRKNVAIPVRSCG